MGETCSEAQEEDFDAEVGDVMNDDLQPEGTGHNPRRVRRDTPWEDVLCSVF